MALVLHSYWKWTSSLGCYCSRHSQNYLDWPRRLGPTYPHSVHLIHPSYCLIQHSWWLASGWVDLLAMISRHFAFCFSPTEIARRWICDDLKGSSSWLVSQAILPICSGWTYQCLAVLASRLSASGSCLLLIPMFQSRPDWVCTCAFEISTDFNFNRSWLILQVKDI